MGDRSAGEKFPPISPEVNLLLYTGFQVHRLMAHPADWGAFIGGEQMIGGRSNPNAWFPTPVSISRLIAKINIGSSAGDTRGKTVCDPCAGTGVMLMEASNYSLRLYAQDVDDTVLKLLRLNGWLFVPWLVWNPAWDVVGLTCEPLLNLKARKRPRRGGR